MLKINNLSVTTHKGRKLIDGFSFVLNAGEHIALIGEEGNGKSTLLKIMAGQDVSDYVSYSGQITADGPVGYLPQTIDAAYHDRTVLQYIGAESPSEDSHYENYSQILQALRQVSLDEEMLERVIETLSGGERVRVALARLLYGDHDILLLDEPTNDLDLPTIIWLEQFISTSPRAIMFISHDEALLENCAEGIVHIEQLRRKQLPHITAAHLPYRQYAQQRLHGIERNNAIAAKENAAFRAQMEKYRRIYQRVQHDQATITRQDPHSGRLLKKKMHAVMSLGRRMEEKRENLTERYDPEEAIDIFFPPVSLNPSKVIVDLHLDELRAGDKLLAEDLSLYVSGGDKLCLIGPNGAGKTTLMRIIRKQLETKADLKVGYMPQNYREVMDYSLTPTAFLNPERLRETDGLVNSYLGALRFTTEEMSHTIDSLSEGQKCKLLLLKLIVEGCDVLLLDEPTRNLSPLSGPRVRQMLVSYGGCIIAVSHDRKFIDEVATRIVSLENGRLQPL
ncbi:MAG: ABC-F family ATP-binding cassette domain-containing protein [Erysipelotrichaceae bacterium]|nr:ABC-F family ATP-binding cassette domain-containing protein [Erysipelotrichaceae bacterium]